MTMPAAGNTAPPSTTYTVQGDTAPAARPGLGTRFRSRAAGVSSRLGSETVQAKVPAGMPRWLGNQRLVVFAWVGALAVVSADEWHANSILPRPARLWWTSLFYGLLCMAGLIPALLPLANALAIGYLIMLVWQYFNKTGQFAS